MTMRAVWKYAIRLGSHAEVETFQIPEGSRLLYCGAQGHDMCMWFEVPVDETQTVHRGFRVFGTGDASIQRHYSYVGTGVFDNGRYVFHLYEVSYE
jgi:hypothetical protein